MFQVLESRYDNIDWYFSTWEESVTPNRVQKLHEDFQGRNFHFYLSAGYDKLSSWFGPGMLSEQVAPDVMKHSYDFVIETRPDVYVEIQEDVPKIDNNAVYFTGLDLVHTLVPGYQIMDHHFGAQDWFFMFDPQVFHIYSQRRLRPGPQDSHGDIIRIAQENGIDIFSMRHHMQTVMIRPNIFQNINEYSWIWEHGMHWINYSREQKIHWLDSQDIAHGDYITSNHNISL